MKMESPMNTNTKLSHQKKIYLLLILSLIPLLNFAQVEFTTWGNLTGIRVEKQLLEFNSSLIVVDQFNNERITIKEGQNISFKRDLEEKIFSFDMDSILWKKTIRSTDNGVAITKIDFSSTMDTILNGAYFRIALPAEFNAETTFKITTPSNFSFKDINNEYNSADYKAPATSMSINSETRQLDISFEKPTEVIIKTKDSIHPDIELNFRIAGGQILANENYSNTFTITAVGKIDNTPLNIKLFPEQQGKPFDGIGGNFRLQNPNVDPQVIDYSLKNLRVSWSRIEMPWRQWHPDLEKDPIEEAKKGNLDPKVKDAMEMAKKLDKMGIPVILAGWFAPDWAIIGERSKGVNLDGSRGNSLDLEKKWEIYKSITSYIKYLKDEYGVVTILFSFNESDLGIDVRQTPEEHNELIQELGVYFRTQGIDTKFLLGDTADANGWEFTTIASIDPETRPYIGGVSFHSWRGWTSENLIKWSDIANRVDLPLFVGEGSIDAGAWRYPQIFEEPTYALDEIDVYLKILNVAQPLTILQWQLTADYSVLSGGGVFGNHIDELYPTQRFFNLKQLGSTPKGLYAIPITTSNKVVTCAAFTNSRKNNFAVHLVNKGADRNAIITGFPKRLKKIRVYTTNKDKSFERADIIPVIDGRISIQLEGASFISLMTN